ncbi:GNAT family N-acetyltransferase [Sulfurimonas sp.]
MLTIKQLNKEQLPLLLNALELESWHVETADINCLYANFSKGFLIAYSDDTVVGFISAIKYSENFGLISNFVVLKEFRTRGFGRELFNHAMSLLDGCQIALESSIEDEYIYVKKGFKSYYDSIYYCFHIDKKSYFANNFNIKNFLDEKEISDKYSIYLNCVASHKDTIVKAIYNDEKLSSYGLCTQHGDGYKVVISSKDNDETLAIFFSLIEKFELSTKIYIEVTKLDANLINIVNLLKMKEHSKKRKMYNKILQ